MIIQNKPCSSYVDGLLAKKGKKRKAPASNNSKQQQKKEAKISVETAADQPKEEVPVENVTATISKKPRKPVAEGCNTGVYNDVEEKNFLEGLELFGRDWGKVSSDRN